MATESTEEHGKIQILERTPISVGLSTSKSRGKDYTARSLVDVVFIS
jgi:hypothetical protein